MTRKTKKAVAKKTPAKKKARITKREAAVRKPKAVRRKKPVIIVTQEGDKFAVEKEPFYMGGEQIVGNQSGPEPSVIEQLGHYGASNTLNRGIYDLVNEARGNLTIAVRDIVDAALAMERGRALNISQRDVLVAEYNLAVTRFELRVHELEQTIRGA
jgi:hypothetical protein